MEITKHNLIFHFKINVAVNLKIQQWMNKGLEKSDKAEINAIILINKLGFGQFYDPDEDFEDWFQIHWL
jgi:hypothetical protein